jgi:hypothetical protein
MMTEPPATDDAAAAWRSRPRQVTHRTSEPTNDLVRATRYRIGSERGMSPSADSLIFAALRLANRDKASREALVAEVGRVERGEPMLIDDDGAVAGE